uniref:Uncharacterized protein n=1 Tax=Romanomermis culicivorax TaxID=13658 RepID=A0A915LB64_ROMCU
MDVEQATSSSASLPPTATLLPPMARTSALPTTLVHTTSLPPMVLMWVQTTTPAQPLLIIATHWVLRAAPSAGTVLHFEPRLPSEASNLPNYMCFGTMDPPHCITLASPHYPPRIDLVPNAPLGNWFEYEYAEYEYGLATAPGTVV